MLEVTPEEVGRRIAAGEDFVLLDVREPIELERARIDFAGCVSAPMSELAARGIAALPAAAQPRDADLVVLCHHGFRSAQVAGWLRQQGWSKVSNLRGGIAAYAARVDPSVGSYP